MDTDCLGVLRGSGARTNMPSGKACGCLETEAADGACFSLCVDNRRDAERAIKSPVSVHTFIMHSRLMGHDKANCMKRLSNNLRVWNQHSPILAPFPRNRRHGDTVTLFLPNCSPFRIVKLHAAPAIAHHPPPLLVAPTINFYGTFSPFK